MRPGKTTLTLQLAAAPPKTIALKLYTPEGAEMPLRVLGSNGWTAQLPHGRDYGISVLRTGWPGRGSERI